MSSSTKSTPLPSMEEMRNKMVQTMDDLIDLYSGDTYMTQRLYTHFLQYLPNTLATEKKAHEERIERQNLLTNEQSIFMQVFLSHHRYFYLHQSDLFYEYDGDRYLIVKEDDIIHKLLSTISKDKVLLQWKQKTRYNIIRLIKERSLFSSIPESETIQNVLSSLHPTYFSTKDAAKYFLTIVGDNLWKKPFNNSVVFILSNPHMRQFIDDLASVGVSSIGSSSVGNGFVARYHESHEYSSCRLLMIQEDKKCSWRDLLKKIGLDLLVVAAHYSNQYENSDHFLETDADEELKNYAYFLKNKTANAVMEDFCQQHIVVSPEAQQVPISWKQVHFVWKLYLAAKGVPSIVFSVKLKSYLRSKYAFQEESDCFIGILCFTSCMYENFMQFWDSTIQVTKEEEDELEVAELCALFKYWAKQQQDPTLIKGQINEENILAFIKHFHTSLSLYETKAGKFVVLGTKSTLWNKKSDIENSLEYVVEVAQAKASKTTASENFVSVEEMYPSYQKYCKNNGVRFLVSKRYFEMCLLKKYSQYTIYDTLIDLKSLMGK